MIGASSITVRPVGPVDNLDEAVKVNNSVRYGLSSSIFTENVNAAFRAIRDLSTGIVYINHGTTGAEIQFPFGGTRGTGNGMREAGQAGLDSFTEWKSVYVDYSGMIYALLRKPGMNPEIHPTEPVLESSIAILSPQGEVRKKIDLYKAFKRSSYSDILHRMAPYGDLFHTNTLEIFDGTHAGKSVLFRKGNALISSRIMDNISIVDLEKEVVVWSMLGNWKSQHQPTLLANGNILLFDNFHKQNASKIIEFNPLSGKPIWVYTGEPLSSFFSATCGSNQRLPNGNTLITESDNGRAFEVTSDGRIVWEFHNPNRAGKNSELVATLFEVIRLDTGYLHTME